MMDCCKAVGAGCHYSLSQPLLGPENWWGLPPPPGFLVANGEHSQRAQGQAGQSGQRCARRGQHPARGSKA